jgi:hypothetical protein
MINRYSKRVTTFRLVFSFLVALCFVLQKNNLTDYVVIVSLLVLFCGIFSMSTIELTASQIKIRKHYFWGLIGLKWCLNFSQVTSLKTKKYEIETHEDAWILTEDMFSFFIFDWFNPKVRWVTTKLSYTANEKIRNIELKMSKDDFQEIAQRIK